MPRIANTSRIETLEVRRLMAVPSALGGTDRVSTDMSNDWQFIRQDVSNAQSASVSDDAWDSVDLPHTFNGDDAADGGNDYYRGGTWYRKEFTPSTKFRGRRVYIGLEGAANKADVYVNGNFAGSHVGAHAAFDIDITGYLTIGQRNLVAIRVDNGLDVNVPGYQGDFSQFGGLTRGVKIFATSKLAVNPTDAGSPGVKMTQRTSARYGNLDIDVSVRNSDKKNIDYTLRTSLVDASGKVVKQVSNDFTALRRKARTFEQSLSLRSPRLWNGTADPYLYTAYTQVIIDGDVFDTVAQTVGFRSISVTDEGLKLNGKTLQLKGVNLHDDKKGVGTAMTNADRDRDVKLMKEMGVNAVRFAHWQVDQDWYDEMDRAGMLVWTEVPLWRRITASQAFTDQSKVAMTELIRQNINHPSIFAWGLYNELPNNADTQSLLTQLNDLAHAEDPSRPTIGATELDNPAAINGIPDINTFNKYYGWYGNYAESADQRLARFGPWLAAQKDADPDGALGMGEYGAGANIDHHVTDPRDGAPPSDPNATQFHPEEYQSYLHEETWQQIEASPDNVFGAFIWQFTDSGNDNRNEGSQPGINDKGLVTYDRKTQKDAFYYYKSQWSNQPTLYLTSKRFTDRTDATTPVKVYSNLGTNVELIVNGESQGTRNDADGVLEWDVTLDSGENLVQVRSTKNGKTYTDSATWTLGASARGAGLAMEAVPATPTKRKDRDTLFGGDAAIV